MDSFEKCMNTKREGLAIARAVGVAEVDKLNVAIKAAAANGDYVKEDVMKAKVEGAHSVIKAIEQEIAKISQPKKGSV